MNELWDAESSKYRVCQYARWLYKFTTGHSIAHKGTWLNKYDTDSPLCVLRIASARIGEISISCKKI